ncbi:hypothetical protein CMV_007151 [Castanea mollissima]|uniref:Uncharacterized protein n=1 Tax=Castanea mollissima TaxID=60419 RepID=A0A8J4VSV5_9ROSI|nr:hypothetical protein CMV_007151 [Castanea mollissima]
MGNPPTTLASSLPQAATTTLKPQPPWCSALTGPKWSIVPGRGGHPTLASLQPGGTITFEHRNLSGTGIDRMAFLQANITCDNT